MRKLLVLIAILALIAAFPLQSLAASGCEFIDGSNINESIITPMYSYTSFINASLSITGGTAQCQGSIQPESGYSTSILVVLYRSVDGSGWTSIASWSDSTGIDGTSSAGGSKALSSGYQYKVTVYGTVRNSSNVIVESPTKTSVIKTY